MVNARLGNPEGLAMLVCLFLHSNAALAVPAMKKLSAVANPKAAILLKYPVFILSPFKINKIEIIFTSLRRLTWKYSLFNNYVKYKNIK
jgi:hypothetical protein